MLLQFFLDSDLSSVPDSLEYRYKGHFYALGLLIFSCFVILAIVRKKNGRFMQVLFNLLRTGGNLDQRLKETIRPGSLTSVLLMLNYNMMFSACIYLGINHLGLWSDSVIAVVAAVAVPLSIQLVQLIPLVFVTGVTGENVPVNTIVANNFIGGQIGGVFLLLLALVWSLNPVFGDQALLVFSVLICLIQLTRLFKNSLLLLSAGVSWYYILLYFCSLEILPLFVASYYVLMNFLN